MEDLTEIVDKSRIDRRLADKIEAELDRINADIARAGHSEVSIDGHVFRVSRKA